MLNTIKRSGRKTATRIDKKTYGRLLAEALPEVIETEAQNRRMNAIADRLQSKRDRSPEEDRLLKLIATLFQAARGVISLSVVFRCMIDVL